MGEQFKTSSPGIYLQMISRLQLLTMNKGFLSWHEQRFMLSLRSFPRQVLIHYVSVGSDLYNKKKGDRMCVIFVVRSRFV